MNNRYSPAIVLDVDCEMKRRCTSLQTARIVRIKQPLNFVILEAQRHGALDARQDDRVVNLGNHSLNFEPVDDVAAL